jgi:hypothetical protein
VSAANGTGAAHSIPSAQECTVSDPNLFRAAGALGAHRRWHPGSPEDELLADLDRVATDRAIDDIVARAPRMTAEQAARVGRIFKYAPPDPEG